MSTPRRICVVTATRAEYGLLAEVMREIQARPQLALQVVVTGAHLSPRFGMTVSAIEADGFAIDARVAMPLDDDSPRGAATAVGTATIGMAEAFERLQPDAVLVLGDRYELLAVASAALLLGIPLLHVAGGEITEGALDDAVRHAVTKLSRQHFVATEVYRRRVVQLGEDPATVHCVGSTGLDNIRRLDLLDRAELSRRIDFDLGGDYLLATYHPVTLGQLGLEALLAVLGARPDLKVVFTGVNADPGHARLTQRLKDFAAQWPGRVKLAASLGQRNYLSAMKHCRAVVGNSSSGIIEAPSLGVPTVNLGERQRGRERAASVIDCQETPEAIAAALDRALAMDCRGVINPYGDCGASARIADIIAATPLARSQPKRFFDL